MPSRISISRSTTSRVWVPISRFGTSPLNRSTRSFFAFGRLRPGMTLADAQVELSGIAGRLDASVSRNRTQNSGVAIEPLHGCLTDAVSIGRSTMVFALALLLLACRMRERHEPAAWCDGRTTIGDCRASCARCGPGRIACGSCLDRASRARSSLAARCRHTARSGARAPGRPQSARSRSSVSYRAAHRRACPHVCLPDGSHRWAHQRRGASNALGRCHSRRSARSVSRTAGDRRLTRHARMAGRGRSRDVVNPSVAGALLVRTYLATGSMSRGFSGDAISC